MDFGKLFDDALANPEVITALEGSGINPLPAIAAEPELKDDILRTHDWLVSLPESFKREPYRMYRAYRSYLDMHDLLISNTHPLLSVGKDRIASWKQAVDEYEALSGGAYPLVTTVTGDSSYLVSHLIPQEYLDLIDNDNRFILAAMRYIPSEDELRSNDDFSREVMRLVINGKEDEIDYSNPSPSHSTGGVVPAGVLSFVLERVDDEPVVRLEWLYVAMEHRNRGLANVLMTQMLSMVSDYHPSAVVADIDQDYLSGDGEFRPQFDPDDAAILREFGITEENEDYDPASDFAPLVHFLSKWRFEVQLRAEDEVYFKVSDLNIPEDDTVRKLKPRPLKSLSEPEFYRALEKYAGNNPSLYDPMLPETDMDRYDEDASCFFMDESGVAGLLLARKNHVGSIVFDLVQSDDGSEENMIGLLSYSLPVIAAKYGMDTVICTPVHQEMALDLYERYAALPKYRINAAAALIEPLNDITTKEWDTVVESLQDLSNEDMRDLALDLAELDMEAV